MVSVGVVLSQLFILTWFVFITTSWVLKEEIKKNVYGLLLKITLLTCIILTQSSLNVAMALETLTQ